MSLALVILAFVGANMLLIAEVVPRLVWVRHVVTARPVVTPVDQQGGTEGVRTSYTLVAPKKLARQVLDEDENAASSPPS